MLELAPTTSSGRDFSRLDIFQYSFSNLARVIAGFTDAVGLSHRFVYIEDYGAPVGLRLALDRPNALAALITQNWPKADFPLSG